MIRFNTMLAIVALSSLLLDAEAFALAQLHPPAVAAHASQHTGSAQGAFGHQKAATSPQSAANALAHFEGRDDRTGGNWRIVYGKEAFLVPAPAGKVHFNTLSANVERGSGIKPGATTNPLLSNLPEAEMALVPFTTQVAPNAPLSDPRVPLSGHGLTTRNNVTFAMRQSAFPDPRTGKLQVQGWPVVIRADITDGRPHRLSFYCLDYLRTGRAMRVDLLDLHGHLLDTHRIDHYGEGAYLRYRVRTSVLAVFSTLTKENPQVAGAFIDPVESRN